MNARRLLPLLFAAVLAGCTQTTERPAPDVPFADAAVGVEQAWWRACFRMPFDAQGEPRWATDLLLADRVAGPALARHRRDIALWRFHRRAGRDGVGHQFSVLFYSDAATATRMLAELQQHPLLPALVAEGALTRLIAPCGGYESPQAIEGTSDPGWAPQLQRTWPYYIMGVSAHWLALIREVGADLPPPPEQPAELLAHYARIGERISAVWRGQGQHAYLHHLSALFGYEPLLIQKYIGF